MINEEDLAKCHYVPYSSMQKVVHVLENKLPRLDTRCKRNLADLQYNKSTSHCFTRQKNKRNMFKVLISRAIYSHDWNKLLYIVKKSLLWENYSTEKYDYILVCTRALTLLLMNHPSAKAQALLQEYMHLVLSCRSLQDKAALLKVMLTLTQKLFTSAPQNES